MHKLYNDQAADGFRVSLWIYQEVLRTSFNNAFHEPLTDRCKTCIQFEELHNPSPEEIAQQDTHRNAYKAARRHKRRAKNRAQQDDSFAAATFDMQQVC